MPTRARRSPLIAGVGPQINQGRDVRLAIALIFILLVLTSPARGAPNGNVFMMAGVLEHWPNTNCTVFHMVGENVWCLLQNYGGFQVGDTVTVAASDFSGVECEGIVFDCLLDNRIGPWRGFDFGCGTVSIDPEYHCERVYSELYGVLALLGGHTGFSTGDSVHLFGTLSLDPCGAISECAGQFCVDFPSATACETPTARISWGRLKALYR